MGEVIQLDAFRYPWRELVTLDGSASTLQVYVNTQTGEVEIVQMNDEGELMRTVIASDDAALLAAALFLKKAGKAK